MPRLFTGIELPEDIVRAVVRVESGAQRRKLD